MDSTTIYEVVVKLVGSIKPAGGEHIDCKRFENLKCLCHLIEYFLRDIHEVAEDAQRQEASMKKMGRYAEEFLEDISTQIQAGE